jgi:hypothetical protein
MHLYLVPGVHLDKVDSTSPHSGRRMSSPGRKPGVRAHCEIWCPFRGDMKLQIGRLCRHLRWLVE